MSVSLRSKKENKIMLIIIISSLLFLILAFTSRLWLFDDEPIMQTPFNEEITALSQTTISLLSWKYNDEGEFMEVIISKKHTGSDVIKPTFDYEVEEESLGSLEHEIILETEDLVVLKIKEVRPDYRFMMLTMEEVRDKETLIVEQKELNDDLEEDELNLPKPIKYVFYGDYREIEKANDLVIKDEDDYRKERLELEIENIEKQIDFIVNDKIKLEQKLAVELEMKIKALKEDLEFQTTEEKEETNLDIESYENDIVNVLQNIKEFEKDVEGLEERIESYKKRIEKIDSNDGLSDETKESLEDEEEVGHDKKEDSKKESEGKASGAA